MQLRKHKKATMIVPNLTSMIDVVFLLLIFFLTFINIEQNKLSPVELVARACRARCRQALTGCRCHTTVRMGPYTAGHRGGASTIHSSRTDIIIRLRSLVSHRYLPTLFRPYAPLAIFRG